MAKRYFSSESEHGNEYSHGFENDTIVRVFFDKTDRDNYVSESENLSCVAIKSSEATKNATNYSLTRNRDIKPEPFSGEFWGIVFYDFNDDDKIKKAYLSYVGKIDICDEYSAYLVERFYK